MRKKNIYFITLLAVLCTGALNPFDCSMNITGRVTYSFPPDRPVAGATVTTVPGDFTADADSNGDFSFEDLPREEYYDIKVSTHGYVGSSRVYSAGTFSCTDSTGAISRFRLQPTP